MSASQDRERAVVIARERVRAMRESYIRLLSSANRYVWSVEMSSLGGNGNLPEKALEELRSAMAHISEAAFIIAAEP